LKDKSIEIIKPTRQKSYGNPDINEILKSFTEVTGLRLVNVKRQRWAASTLLKVEPKSRILGAIQFIGATMSDRYAPRITDVEKLYWKWNELEIYGRKKASTMVNNKQVDLKDLR
jgi:hypothetical protein